MSHPTAFHPRDGIISQNNIDVEGIPMALQLLAKQNRMKRTSCMSLAEAEVFGAPARSQPSRLVIEELRQRLNLAEGHELAFERLACMLGVPKSSLCNWCSHIELPAVHVVLGLLERLPQTEQVAFLRRHCRLHATLDHPALAHEPAVTEYLSSLLGLGSGVTAIEGRSDFARSFVLNALGQSFSRQDSRHRPPAGLICKSPGTFVPIEGILYLRTGLPPDRIRQLVAQVWPKIRAADTGLILLDGIWSQVPDARPRILELARTKHVVLTDALKPGARFDSESGPVNRLVVHGTPVTPIQVDIQGQ